MTLTTEHLNLAAIIVSVVLPVTIAIAVTYKKTDRKIVSHDERIYGHDEDLQQVNKKIEKMEAQHREDIKGLNEKMDHMDDKNSAQHSELFKISNSTNTIVAELKGYLMGKNEKPN